MSVKDRVRKAVYGLLYTLTGPGQEVRVILLYHSIGGGASHSVQLSTFEHQMEMLARCFTMVRLRDLPEAMASASADTNLACVTFDDGYQDNYTHALPVLERLGIKSTFFIATSFLGQSFPTFAGELPMMTAAQVRDLAALGHEIGAHTVTHPKLTKVPLETAREEIQTSKHFLEDTLQSEIVSFAYPKGDYNKAVETLVRSLGFELGVTVREDLVDEEANRLALPRVSISNNLAMNAFAAKVSPAARWYARLRRWD
jgi:peptidoglycan/xylan/chitin deacetylase (PgdA/CDA1 family)